MAIVLSLISLFACISFGSPLKNPYLALASTVTPLGPVPTTTSSATTLSASTPPRRLLTIGDSYAAGPGSSEDYDTISDNNGVPCGRSKLAYGPQLLDLSRNQFDDFQFLACDGHDGKDVIDWQVDQMKWDDHENIVTLSVGGNDLGFNKVLEWCLYAPNWISDTSMKSCDKFIDDFANLTSAGLVNDTFYSSLRDVWRQVADPKSGVILRKYPLVTHTLYPRLFNADTPGCNNQALSQDFVRLNFKGMSTNGANLITATRKKLNSMIDIINKRIRDHLTKFLEQPENYGALGRIQLFDPNTIYEGHRLCEEDSGGFSQLHPWFLASSPKAPTIIEIPSSLDPSGCNFQGIDMATDLGCAYAQASDEEKAKLENELQIPRNGSKAVSSGSIGNISVSVERERENLMMQAFDPKATGSKAIAEQIWGLYNKWDPSHQVYKRSQNIRVLPLGDSITNGFASSDNNGYRKVFYDLAKQGGQVQMIGSHNGKGNMDQNNEEGWDTFTIEQISKKATNALKAQPNVVMLMAGTNNMFTDEQAAAAPKLLELLIDQILITNKDIVLLVTTIIPSSDPDRQARNDAYNTAMKEIVQRIRQKDYGPKVMLLHMDTAVQKDQLGDDGIHPNDEGYRNIALHWLQGLNEAEMRGWIVKPVPGNGHVQPSGANGNRRIQHSVALISLVIAAAFLC